MFIWVCYFSVDGRIELIACLLFYLFLKMETLSFCKKPHQTFKTAVKTLKKSPKCSNNNTQKVSDIIIWIFR